MKLGVPSLWDVDEGNNAEAAREMLVSGDWIVPTFNYQLRTDKPALLYWLQMAGYALVGPSELGARLPSAMASWLAVLVVYELGRRMLGASAGCLSGLIFASFIGVSAAAHFANPDALLLLCTVLTFLCFWHVLECNSGWSFAAAGISAGAAVMAKGPVGITLPTLFLVTYFVCGREWSRLWDWRWLAAGTICWTVALPWYICVGVKTHFDFLRDFLLIHNFGRFRSAMEGHGGAPWYYLICLLVGTAPWSALLGPALWDLRRPNAAGVDSVRATRVSRFLVIWFATYLIFFTLSSTKLPNYVLPVYPALAIIGARHLDLWRRGLIPVRHWQYAFSLGSWTLIGVITLGGTLILAGVVQWPNLDSRSVCGLDWGIGIGLIPIGAAMICWCLVRYINQPAFVSIWTVMAIAYVAALGAWCGTAVDSQKAPRSLADAILRAAGNTDYRVICYRCFEPSLVFYARREVIHCTRAEEVVQSLQYAIPVYALLRDQDWEHIKSSVKNASVLARRRDMYKNCDILLIRNWS